MKKVFAAVCLFTVLILTFNIIPVYASTEKQVYITFDDGPSSVYTPKILNLLQKHKIKASFFVVGTNVDENPLLLKNIYSQGHSIGIHCYSHIYSKLYKNNESFNSDLQKSISTVKKFLPYCNIKYYRFPGGSFDKTEAMKQTVRTYGLKIIDWNCISGDAQIKNITPEEAVATVKTSSYGKKKVVLLMHDNKRITAEILEYVITFFKNNGYVFKKLT